MYRLSDLFHICTYAQSVCEAHATNSEIHSIGLGLAYVNFDGSNERGVLSKHLKCMTATQTLLEHVKVGIPLPIYLRYMYS